MLLLALTALRACAFHDDMARLVLQGELPGALRMGMDRYERLQSQSVPTQSRALLGQLLGRAMLACAREEEAEEIFQRQLKVYEGVSRQSVRWLGTLDQGALHLHLNRTSRAAECFHSVADDRHAPDDLRLEAMASAAFALQRVGDCSVALQGLEAAHRMAQGPSARLVEALLLELRVLQQERSRESLDDHALCAVYRDEFTDAAPCRQLSGQLAAAADALGQDMPMVAFRLRHLGQVLLAEGNGMAALSHINASLLWLQGRQLAGFESQLRVEAGLMLIGRKAWSAAGDVLEKMIYNEQEVRRSRYAMELQYCLAKLHQQQGRHVDALRLYSQHTQQAVQALKSTRASRSMPATCRGGKSDASRMRLPLRYRHAYQYLMENLQDDQLSVRQLAAHAGVTERALQLAFRTHLGMTPVELIRSRRMERIRTELQEQRGSESVLEIASRWGIKHRSTLAQNYRFQFHETPTQTLLGGLSAHHAARPSKHDPI